MQKALLDNLGRRRAVAGAAALAMALAVGAAPVLAQDKYPSKPVSVIVPYPPGGLADQIARLITPPLEAQLGQPFVIVNKPGATGGIGAKAAATSAPDGYTLLITLIGISTLPAVSAAQGKPPMYTRDQFAPIALLASDPTAITVQKSAPWNTVQELIADAKKRPDEIIYISTGPFGPTHLPAEMFMGLTGIKMRHLPTTGGAPAITMLLSGGGHLFFSIPALAAQHVQSGAFKVLASTSAKRMPEFGNPPTLKELGIDLEFAVWGGMWAPKGTPPEILKTLDAAVTKAAADPKVQATFKKSNVPLAHLNAKDFAVWWDKETDRLEAIIKKITANDPKKK
jgi:tripartite-type tricarboxylate transporter receptor subunit TctC